MSFNQLSLSYIYRYCLMYSSDEGDCCELKAEEVIFNFLRLTRI